MFEYFSLSFFKVSIFDIFETITAIVAPTDFDHNPINLIYMCLAQGFGKKTRGIVIQPLMQKSNRCKFRRKKTTRSQPGVGLISSIFASFFLFYQDVNQPFITSLPNVDIDLTI